MIIQFDITSNQHYVDLMLNTPLKYKGIKVGKIIDTKMLDSGEVIVKAKIYKKYESLIKDKMNDS